MKQQYLIAFLSPLIACTATYGDLVFQADWNGSDSGTGGATDVVSIGGTGRIQTNGQTGTTASIVATPSLGSGNLFSASITNDSVGSSNVVRADLTPTNAASSFESWFSVSGTGQSSLNGGFDFFLSKERGCD